MKSKKVFPSYFSKTRTRNMFLLLLGLIPVRSKAKYFYLKMLEKAHVFLIHSWDSAFAWISVNFSSFANNYFSSQSYFFRTKTIQKLPSLVFQNYGSPTRAFRLKVAPNMADPSTERDSIRMRVYNGDLEREKCFWEQLFKSTNIAVNVWFLQFFLLTRKKGRSLTEGQMPPPPMLPLGAASGSSIFLMDLL